MKLFAAVKWVNRYGAAVVMAAILLVLCTFAHCMALAKMDFVQRQFPVMNARTVQNMALIDFLNGHRWFAACFIFAFISGLLYLEVRDAPRWSVWLVFLFLAVPCVAYLSVCASILNKFTF